MLLKESLTPILGEFLFERTETLISCSFRGGVDINDSSLGLNVKQWLCYYENNNIYLTNNDYTLPLLILENISNLTSISACFDQNMQIQIAYLLNNTGYLYWFDPSLNSYTTILLSTNLNSLLIILDDIRDFNLANSNCTLGYVFNNTLILRYQSERYTIEHVFKSNLPNKVKLKAMGLTDKFRIQFKLES